MRRLMQHDDKGATTIFVVVLMPLLLLAGAFVFDGGRAYIGKRETQNSADAAALAMATDCARGVNCNNAATAANYKRNTEVKSASCDVAVATCTVTMTKQIDQAFGGVGHSGPVARTGIAKWGTLNASSSIPLAVSACEWSQALLDGTTDIIIYIDDPTPHSGCSSLPGGFGQLDNVSCVITPGAGPGPLPAGDVAWYHGDPGGDMKKMVPCITNKVPPSATPLPHDILVPLYDSNWCLTHDCKGNKWYPIKGYAEFRVTGYNFNGGADGGTLKGIPCPIRPGEDKKVTPPYCIQGDFIRYVTGNGTVGSGGSNFGASVVYLSYN